MNYVVYCRLCQLINTFIRHTHAGATTEWHSVVKIRWGEVLTRGDLAQLLYNSLLSPISSPFPSCPFSASLSIPSPSPPPNNSYGIFWRLVAPKRRNLSDISPTPPQIYTRGSNITHDSMTHTLTNDQPNERESLLQDFIRASNFTTLTSFVIEMSRQWTSIYVPLPLSLMKFLNEIGLITTNNELDSAADWTVYPCRIVCWNFALELYFTIRRKWKERTEREEITRPVCKGGVTGVVTSTPPPKFIRSTIFWVNLWQLYYSDSTVFKFCTSMWL